MTFELFIFPSQVTQVFLRKNLKKLSWKAVLWKEAHFKKEVGDVENVFITTTMESGGLSVLMGLPSPPSIPSLIGAIELFGKNNLQVYAHFKNKQNDSILFHISWNIDFVWKSKVDNKLSIFLHTFESLKLKRKFAQTLLTHIQFVGKQHLM